MAIRDPEIRLVYRLVCLFVSIALVDVRRPSLGVALDCMRVEKANRIQTVCVHSLCSGPAVLGSDCWDYNLEL